MKHYKSYNKYTVLLIQLNSTEEILTHCNYVWELSVRLKTCSISREKELTN